MLKTLFTGLLLGTGLVVGIAVTGMVGLYAVADKMEAATQRATDGLERANAALAREFPAPLYGDNLEAYSECLRAFDNGDVSATVDSCRDEYRDWLDSPTFSEELTKFRRIDPRGAEIMAAYRNANPEATFD